jgi:menaquinone-dependent protoporphyrinogen oxidase
VATQTFWLRCPEDLPKQTLDEFDGVIVGGAIYVGKFSPLLLEWTKLHSAQLNQMTTAFFAVGLQACDPRPAEQETHRQMVQTFLDESGLKPKLVASFAGALRYTKYPLPKRWMMKRIAQMVGLPTDTHRDHELTDWTEVAAFAKKIAATKADSPSLAVAGR